MATRDDLLFTLVGGFRKNNSYVHGHEVRIVGTYANGTWYPDAGCEYNESTPIGGVLELSVMENVEDEAIVVPITYCPVSFSGYVQQDTNLGKFKYKTWGWSPVEKTVTFTIPAFTRAGKLVVEDDSGNQCADFGKFVSTSVEGGNGTIAVHEILTDGGKLFHALKAFDLLDALYKLKQSTSKGPRPCPRCDGSGADSDYKTRLKTRSDELFAVNGYKPSDALIYAEEETKFCALCEGKRFLKDDHEIPEFLLDNFLDWQGAPYSGKSLPDKIAMAFVCNYNAVQSEDGIANFLSKVFDVEPSSVFFSSDVCKQNVVVYIGFKGQPGPNALFEDRTHFQWILDTIRPVGIEYFAADSVSDFEEDWLFYDIMQESAIDYNNGPISATPSLSNRGTEFSANYTDEVPALWFATTMGEQCNRFEDRFDGSQIKISETTTGYDLPGTWTGSGDISYGYHDIDAAWMFEGSAITRTISLPSTTPPAIDAWNMVFMFQPEIDAVATFSFDATVFSVQLRHAECYVKVEYTPGTTNYLKVYYTDKDSEEYKLQNTYSDSSAMAFTSFTLTATSGKFLLIDVHNSWEVEHSVLASNFNFGITFDQLNGIYGGKDLQDDILAAYADPATPTAINYSQTHVLDDTFADYDMDDGDKWTLGPFRGEPRNINFSVATSNTMAFGIQDGPRFRINNAAGTLDVIDENNVSYCGLSITSTTYWNDYEIQDHGDQFDFRVNDRKSGPSVTKQFCKVVGIKKKSGYDSFEIEALEDGANIKLDYIITGDGKWETFW